MSDEPFHSRIAALLRALAPKAKQPASATILNNWIAQAEGKLGPEAKGGRLGWLIASSVAIAAVQRAIDAHGRQLFLLKGGTLLQHLLDATARTTKDVDGLVRGDLDAFLLALEEALAEPWGPLTLRRGEVEVVDVPTKIIKPRRFDIILELRGVTWRRIQFEVSPDEAGIGGDSEAIEPPPLGGFGLPDPDTLVGIAMRFQIAQKLHAVSDPHDPPDSINDRARDVVDLLLLRDLAARTGSPTLPEVRAAGIALFEARAEEARQLGLPTRSWPPTVTGHVHWGDDFARAANSAYLELSLDAAAADVNAWIAEIATRTIPDLAQPVGRRSARRRCGSCNRQGQATGGTTVRLLADRCWPTARRPLPGSESAQARSACRRSTDRGRAPSAHPGVRRSRGRPADRAPPSSS